MKCLFSRQEYFLNESCVMSQPAAQSPRFSVEQRKYYKYYNLFKNISSALNIFYVIP